MQHNWKTELPGAIPRCTKCRVWKTDYSEKQPCKSVPKMNGSPWASMTF
jgi:hypothetical protein